MVIKTTGKELSSSTGDWAESVLETAYSLNLISKSSTPLTEADKAVSREKVASISVNAVSNILKEDTSSISTSDGAEYVRDISSVSSSYKNDVIKAYKLGIVTGDTNNNYNPADSLKRSEACVVITRLAGLTDRATPTKLTPLPIEPSTEQTNIALPQYYPNGLKYDPLPDGSNVYNDLVYPGEGSMFNGRPITRDPETGVLGFGNGQKGGIYMGLTLSKNGITITIKEGTIAPTSYDRISGAYVTWNGYSYWGNEWNSIHGAAVRQLNATGHKVGKPGEYSDIYGNIQTSKSQDSFLYWNDEYICWATIPGIL